MEEIKTGQEESQKSYLTLQDIEREIQNTTELMTQVENEAREKMKADIEKDTNTFLSEIHPLVAIYLMHKIKKSVLMEQVKVLKKGKLIIV